MADDSEEPSDESDSSESDSGIDRLLRDDDEDPSAIETEGGSSPTGEQENDAEGDSGFIFEGGSDKPMSESSSESSDNSGGRLWDDFGDREQEGRDRSSGQETKRAGGGRLWDSFGETSETESRESSGSGRKRQAEGDSETPSASGEKRGVGEVAGDEPTTTSQESRFEAMTEQLGSSGSPASTSTGRDESAVVEELFSDLDEFDRATSGSQVLVLSPLNHQMTDEICSNFLTAGGTSGRNVLFVTMVESPSDRLEICRTNEKWTGGNVAVVEIGSQSNEGADSETYTVAGNSVVYKHISGPRNLSKAGVVITQTLKKWQDSDRPSVVCFHSISALSQYVEMQTLFQFLFTLQGKLSSFGMTGHYHMDPTKHEESEINTLRSIFDLVLRLTPDGELEIE